jgi:integrase
MFKPGHKPAHTGTITTTDPIRGDDIQKVREYLADRPRDLAIWSVGTNSALRAGDMLSLKWDELEDDGTRISFTLRESKTHKLRKITLNAQVSSDVRVWRSMSESEWCFSSQRGGPLGVPALGRMIKHFAKEAGVGAKRVSSHSLRKTWCRAHADRGVPLHQLMWALNHSSERQTAQYLGLLTDEVASLYEHVV